MPYEKTFHGRLEKWFGPADRRLADIVWPVLFIPVMTVAGALALWLLFTLARPA